MRTSLLALLALVSACDGGASGTPGSADAQAAVDAASADARAPDATLPDASARLQCACAEGPEDCAACIALIGRCCTGDATFGGRLDYLVATCQGNPACAACCDECAARDCAAVVAAGDCPVPPDEQ
ncbi:MAG: hypothetical protein R3F60_30425 [bacterium]